MSETPKAKAETQSPQARLIQMATAHWISRFLYVAALMNLADHLAERPKTAEELAPLTAATVPSLYRLMRTLASLGLFTEDSARRFSLTPLSEVLRSDTPGSVRSAVLFMGGETSARSLDQLKAKLLAFDSTLAKALNRSRRKIDYQLEKMEMKIARQTMLRDERATHDAAALTNFIYPHRHLQERLYSILPFLAKFGPGLIDSIYENVHVDCPDHKFVTL